MLYADAVAIGTVQTVEVSDTGMEHWPALPLPTRDRPVSPDVEPLGESGAEGAGKAAVVGPVRKGRDRAEGGVVLESGAEGSGKAAVVGPVRKGAGRVEGGVVRESGAEGAGKAAVVGPVRKKFWQKKYLQK